MVLVTGATGALGPAIVDELLRSGYRVRAHGRTVRPGLFSPEVEMVAGDLTNPADARRVAEGARRVVHLAAMLHVNNPAPHLEAEYRRVNVEGTKNLVDAAVEHGVSRLVYISTIAVYGYDRGDLLTEESDLLPSTPYAVTKLEGERLVLSSRSRDDVPIGVVLRLAAVYGARFKGNYRRLLRALQRRRFLPVGRGENRRTLVHERDVARAAVVALSHPRAAGRVFNVTDGTIHTVSEIVDAISSALGRKPPRFAIPLAFVRIAGTVIDGAIRIAGGRAVIGPAIQKYTEDVTVSSAAIERELGFTPEMDLASGWRDVVARMSASDF